MAGALFIAKKALSGNPGAGKCDRFTKIHKLRIDGSDNLIHAAYAGVERNGHTRK
jgi:hypothetical protein